MKSMQMVIPARTESPQAGSPGSAYLEQFRPSRHLLFMVYGEPELRPPVYDEMVSDMTNIIHKAAAVSVDQSCVELQFDELVSTCWEKTTEMVSKGLVNRSRNRLEYFKQYKTAILNHLRSLIQKHRFTEKRTGIKPPPKDQRGVFTGAPTKPQEVRIDDPESGFQISNLAAECDSMAMRELMEEVTYRLSYLEVGVLQQLMSPNELTLHLAKQDAERGREFGEPLRIRIRHEHLAHGIDKSITVAHFEQVRESLKEKYTLMKINEDDPRRAAALATLLQFFGIQVPQTAEETTRKRALMLAAQHQFDRLSSSPGIKEAMAICGIPVPQVRNDRFACLGVMFQKHHRTCINCGMRAPCELKAANFGLGEITISHKLLGARHARVPVIQPTDHRDTSIALVESEREEELLAFMDENFRAIRHQGELCYRHKDRTGGQGMQFVFSLGKQVVPFRLRFINPSEELKLGLKLESGEKGGRPSYYLPDNLDVEQSLNLIRAHAQITYVKA